MPLTAMKQLILLLALVVPAGLSIDMAVFCEWAGCITGAAGAFTIAQNRWWSKYAFIPYLASNAFWIGYGLITGTAGIVVMQACFTYTSLMGIRNWITRPQQQPATP